MAVAAGVGYLVAILSAFFNGSFASPFNFPQVKRCALHPVLFQLYVSIGVFLSSWLALAFLKYNKSLTGADDGPSFPFPLLGMLGGALFVLSVAFSFAAIPNIGLAMAQGIWGGTAIIVAFIWGVAAFGNEIVTPGLAGAAIVLLLSGVVGIAFCKNIAAYLFGEDFEQKEQEPLAANAKDYKGVPEDDVEHLNMRDKDTPPNEVRKWMTGVLCAIAVGLAGGSTLVPLNYVPKDLGGLGFLPAFGCGAMITSPLICLFWIAYTREIPALHIKETLWVGILSGTLWNLGNVCSIIAIPALSYSVAYPILQCALFVAGLWGIFVFREISGRAIIVFFVAGLILILGAICLALSEIKL